MNGATVILAVDLIALWALWFVRPARRGAAPGRKRVGR